MSLCQAIVFGAESTDMSEVIVKEEENEELESYLDARSQMSVSQNGYSLIKQFEGCRLTAYKAVSTEKYYTIGWGHYGSDVYAGMTITQAQADAYLVQDVASSQKAVNTFLSTNGISIGQNQFDALVSFTYNLGNVWVSTPTFQLKTILKNGYRNYTDSQIRTAFTNWNKSGGNVIAGLTRRRNAEADLFLSGITVSTGIEQWVDDISGHVGMIHVKGWAIDMANKTKSLQIDIYIGGPAGSKNVDIIGVMAKDVRTDVAAVYPGAGNYHGFDTEIYTWRSGSVPVYVYAHNAAMTDATLLLSKTVTVTADKTPPVISEVKVTNKTKDGYTISCKVTDNGAIAEVKFPTWTVANGDDDIVWVPGTKNGNYYSANIKVSDHKNEGGTYATHIYATDKNGNKSCNTSQENIYIDRTAPVISNVKISNIDETGYTVSCTATDNTGIKSVKFPTWTEKNGQDDLGGWSGSYTAYDGIKSGNTYTFRVKISAHGNQRGNYITHIYAEDAYGNYVGYTTTPIIFVPNKYTVAYSANGGSGAPGSQTKWEKTTLKLSTTKPYKNYTITYNGNGGTAGSANKSVGCTFKSWNTNAAGTGTAYSAGGNYTANTSATLYAQWQNPTAGNLASASRTGYTFDGWYTAANGGSKVTAATTITGNTTLYAHWTIIKYSVAYNANGGSGAPGSQTKEYGKALTLSSTKPYKNYTITYNGNGGTAGGANKSVSCTFKNWNTNAAGTGTAYNAGASYNANSSATLYAQWQNSAAGNLANASRTGYTFDGWYTEPTGGILVTKDTIIDKNMTVYAHWKAKLSVTVTVSNAELIVGENTVVQAHVSGGSGTYTYRYQIHNLETDGWSYVTEETASPTYTWIAQTAGTREFYVEVRDSNEEVARSEAVKVEVKAKEKTLSITGKASVSEVAVGNTVTISATAAGGTGNYTYSFLIHNLENDTWYRWAFDKNAQHVWTASGSGDREFFAEVKDAAGTVVRSAAMKVTVKTYDVPLTITGNVSEHQVNAGEQVVIYAAVAGGSGNYTYSFLIHNLDTDAWYRFGDFGTASQYVWTANGSGNREFFVEVKDAAGAVVRSEAMKVTVGDGSSTGALQIQASADKKQVTSGDVVMINASATGGTGNYTYSFLVHNLANDSWYRFGDFAAASSYTWTAGSAGTREFFVEVKDGNGTVVRSSAVIVDVK